ncbi:MAG: hypothetical protein ABSC20_01065 [Candidatus Bathyarchaeia archaeon]|jgi:hypothetical protein
MEIQNRNTNAAPVANLVDWVAKNPTKATEVGISLVIIGGFIVLLDALFKS